MVDLPIGNIVTAIATVISVVIANRLSSSQTGKAKLWDLRRQTYGVIASELSSVERICEAANYSISENSHDYHASETMGLHNRKINEHMNTARQRFSDDYLIVSDSFINAFSNLERDLDAISPEEFFPDDHNMFYAAIRKHRPIILAQGRKEMSIKFRPWNI